MARDVRRATLHRDASPLYGRVTGRGPWHLLGGTPVAPVTRCAGSRVHSPHSPGAWGYLTPLCNACQTVARRELRETEHG